MVTPAYLIIDSKTKEGKKLVENLLEILLERGVEKLDPEESANAALAEVLGEKQSQRPPPKFRTPSGETIH